MAFHGTLVIRGPSGQTFKLDAQFMEFQEETPGTWLANVMNDGGDAVGLIRVTKGKPAGAEDIEWFSGDDYALISGSITA